MTFATLHDLSAFVGETVDNQQGHAILKNATEYLRGEIGAYIAPSTTATVTEKVRPGEHWIELPQWPTAVTEVTVNGTSTDDWELVDGAVWIDRTPAATDSYWCAVQVTFTYGASTVPADVREACLIVAAQMHTSADENGSPSNAGIQSTTTQLDDWSQTTTYATGPGATASFELPRLVADRLREKYGPQPHRSRWP